MPRDANALIKSAAMYAGVVVNQTRHSPSSSPCKGYTIPYTQRVNNGTFSSEMYPSMGIASYNAACVFCYNVHRLMGFSKGIARVNQSDLPVLSCDTATFNSCDVDKRKLDLYRDERRIIVFDYLFLTNF